MSASLSFKGPIAVIKLGGSILTSGRAYRRAAIFVRNTLRSTPDERLVIVVSAQEGATDTLERRARAIVAQPARAALDLLWSTGEIRSVALLTMHLQSLGVSAASLNIHQAGLTVPDNGREAGHIHFNAAAIFAALTRHSVVVVPGFLATDSAHAIVSLGRGGSDLTAVLLAEGLCACRCELIKDVPGYFTADPHRDSTAKHIPQLTFADALGFAARRCDLVQQKAIEAASRSGLPLVIRSIGKNAQVSRISDHHTISASVEATTAEALAS